MSLSMGISKPFDTTARPNLRMKGPGLYKITWADSGRRGGQILKLAWAREEM